MDSVGHPAAWLHLFVDFGSNISTGKHKHRQHNVISEYQTLVQTPNIFPLYIIRLLDWTVSTNTDRYYIHYILLYNN